MKKMTFELVAVEIFFPQTNDGITGVLNRKFSVAYESQNVNITLSKTEKNTLQKSFVSIFKTAPDP